MSQRKLSQGERDQIYQRKQAGEGLREISQALGISIGCVRKWWRRGRDQGQQVWWNANEGESRKAVWRASP